MFTRGEGHCIEKAFQIFISEGSLGYLDRRERDRKSFDLVPKYDGEPHKGFKQGMA